MIPKPTPALLRVLAMNKNLMFRQVCMGFNVIMRSHMRARRESVVKVVKKLPLNLRSKHEREG